MTRVGAVILAAGRSSRWRAAGGAEATKLVAEVAGKPIVRRVAEAALASRTRPVIAVLGHEREAVETALAGLDVTTAVNQNFASGIASSLRTGLAALPADVAAALVLLGDMPDIASPLIDRLIESFAASPGVLAVAPVTGGRRGNPVLIARGLFGPAMALEGDEGARRLLAGLAPGAVAEVETTGAGAAFDVDTPEDLAAASSGDGERN